jgi:MFS family permease
MRTTQVLELLLEPIGSALSLSYLQLGTLSSALLIFFALASLPISIAAERVGNRARLLAGGVVTWTVFAALSGAVSSYPALLLCRVMVGVGEATVSPCATTLISDTFPPAQRPVALAIYLAGIPLGTTVGFTTAHSATRTQHYDSSGTQCSH